MTVREFIESFVERGWVKPHNDNVYSTTDRCKQYYREHDLTEWRHFASITKDEQLHPVLMIWVPPKVNQRDQWDNANRWSYVNLWIDSADMDLSKLYSNPDWQRVYALTVFFGEEDILSPFKADEYVDLDNIVF